MIVPTSNLPINPAMLANDNSEQPSQANLLMAAAEMHRMGKFGEQPVPHPKALPKARQKDL